MRERWGRKTRHPRVCRSRVRQPCCCLNRGSNKLRESNVLHCMYVVFTLLPHSAPLLRRRPCLRQAVIRNRSNFYIIMHSFHGSCSLSSCLFAGLQTQPGKRSAHVLSGFRELRAPRYIVLRTAFFPTFDFSTRVSTSSTCISAVAQDLNEDPAYF